MRQRLTDHVGRQAAAYRQCCVNLDDMSLCEQGEGGKEGGSTLAKGSKGIHVVFLGEEMKQQVISLSYTDTCTYTCTPSYLNLLHTQTSHTHLPPLQLSTPFLHFS